MSAISVRVTQEDDWFVALCLDYDVASQGPTLQSALANIKEVVSTFLELASEDEVQRRIDELGRIHIVSLGDEAVDSTLRPHID